MYGSDRTCYHEEIWESRDVCPQIGFGPALRVVVLLNGIAQVTDNLERILVLVQLVVRDIQVDLLCAHRCESGRENNDVKRQFFPCGQDIRWK
jgi:hypothetical protein